MVDKMVAVLAHSIYKMMGLIVIISQSRWSSVKPPLLGEDRGQDVGGGGQ